MPAPNLGLVGAGGAAGVQNEIQAMVAERRAAEVLAFNQAIAKRKAAVEEQNAKTNEWEALARLTAGRKANDPTVVRGLKSADPNKTGAYVVGMDPYGNRVWEAPQEPDAAGGGSSDAFERFVRERWEPERLRDWVTKGYPGQPPPLTTEEVVDMKRKFSAYAPAIVQGTFGPMSTGGDPLRENTQYVLGPDEKPVGRPQDAATVKRMGDLSSVTQAMDKVKQLYRPEYVGAITGRKNQLLLNAPDAWTPDWLAKTTPEMASMGAWLASIKNAMVLKLTGLAATDQQMKQILAEIPDWPDEPVLFEAKLRKTEENDQLLNDEIRRLSALSPGAGGPLPPGFKPPGGGATPPPSTRPPGGLDLPPSGGAAAAGGAAATGTGGRGWRPQTAEDMQNQLKPFTGEIRGPDREGRYWGIKPDGSGIEVSKSGKIIGR